MKIHVYPRDRRALEKLFAADEAHDAGIEQTVRAIITEVRARGDAALIDYGAKFDGAKLTAKTLRLPAATAAEAWRRLSAPLKRAVKQAHANIKMFHVAQRRKGFVLKTADGARLEQRVRPLRRVGCYVPGGAAVLPSSLLMNVVPAQVAGVDEIVVCTPPTKGAPEDSVILAVAHHLGIGGNVYQAGGAQAVAAMAYGTSTIPKVDKVVGPGNRYVALAKRLLYGTIDIDSVAGNSEIMVIADATADQALVASDLVAQAEHTGEETLTLVGIGADYDFRAVEAEVERQTAAAPRAELIRRSFASGCVFVRVADADGAVEIAEMKGPEHLLVMADGARAMVDRIRNVGAAFIGPFSPVAAGDYAAGPNHVLPTGGTARFFGPLGVDAFVKTSNVIELGERGLEAIAGTIITFAEAEGLHGHAESVRWRSATRKPGKPA